MEFKEFAIILTKASIVLNYNLTEQAILAWYELFATEPKEIFVTALRKVVKEPNRKFFPTAGEVSAAIEILKNGEQVTAREAWDKLITYAQRSIPEDRVIELEKDNQVLINAMKQVEYSKIRYSDLEKELPYLKAAFIKAYDSKNFERETVKQLQVNANERKILDDTGLTKAIGL